jgi:hypothetical protein
MKLVLIGLCAALTLFARPAAGQSGTDDEPAANPARPTVATPATLTPVGYLQFETGVLGANHSPEFSSRTSLNEVTKLSVASRLELLASGEPFVHYDSFGQKGNTAADISVGAQAVLRQGEGAAPTVAASYFYHAHDSGGPGLDFGSPANSFLLLASADVKGFHYDVNAMFNELVEGNVRRAQFGQTLSISHPIKGNFTLAGEIWHFTQPFLRGHCVGNLWAVSYAARKTLVLDAGFNRGLTGTSTRWEAFAGFTYLLPHRLW